MKTKKLRITRTQLLQAVRTGRQRQLVARALRDVGLRDCSDCADKLLRRVDQLTAKMIR